MNVSIFSQMAYENKHNWTLGQNKPNSKPIQTQTNPICRMPKMSVNSILTKDYERNDIFAIPENKPNSNPNKPNLPDAQRVKKKSDAGSQRSDICLLPSVFAVRHPVYWLLSMAPMIAIGFDYNGIFDCRKQAINKILFSVLVPALPFSVTVLLSECCELGPVGFEPTTNGL
jgi:hypothetical protein